MNCPQCGHPIIDHRGYCCDGCNFSEAAALLAAQRAAACKRLKDFGYAYLYCKQIGSIQGMREYRVLIGCMIASYRTIGILKSPKE